MLLIPSFSPLPGFDSPQSIPDHGEAHLWLLDMEDWSQNHIAEAQQLLSAEEQARAQRFIRGGEAYVASRWLQRRLLGYYTQTHPAELQLARTHRGKPYLPENNLQFNLSHSGRWVLLALAQGLAVGVDVEHPQSLRGFIDIANHYFHLDEQRWLQQLDPVAQEHGFYRLWTLKEALFKALGIGIAAGLESAAFQLTGHSPRVMLNASLYHSTHQWHFHQWSLPGNSLAALAYAAPKGLNCHWFNALTLPAFA
jgi:4'-phosphopantetheinyl transferase